MGKNASLPEVNYYSQYKEDEWLEENEVLPEFGVFVDVGAGRLEYSNTYHFEEKGWDGIAIDAEPRNYADLLEMRKHPFFSAVREWDGVTGFFMHTFDSDLSRSTERLSEEDKEIFVPCFRLETILNIFQIGNIDLLSVDVEGLELEVLNSMDMEKHQPEVIIVEHETTGQPSQKEQIKQYFSSRPYKKIHETGSNLIFKRDV